jgi:hypothetical protein
LLETIRLGVISLHPNRTFALSEQLRVHESLPFVPHPHGLALSGPLSLLLLQLNHLLLELQTRYIYTRPDVVCSLLSSVRMTQTIGVADSPNLAVLRAVDTICRTSRSSLLLA